MGVGFRVNPESDLFHGVEGGNEFEGLAVTCRQRKEHRAACVELFLVVELKKVTFLEIACALEGG